MFLIYKQLLSSNIQNGDNKVIKDGMFIFVRYSEDIIAAFF